MLEPLPVGRLHCSCSCRWHAQRVPLARASSAARRVGVFSWPRNVCVHLGGWICWPDAASSTQQHMHAWRLVFRTIPILLRAPSALLGLVRMVWASNAAADSTRRSHPSRCRSGFLQAYRVRDDRVRSRLWWRQNVRTVTCAPDTPLVRSYGTHVGSEKLCNSHTCTLQTECCLSGRISLRNSGWK